MELSVSPHLLTSPCTSSSSLLLKTRVRVSQTTLIPPRFQQLPLCSAHPCHILSPMDARQSTVTRASLVEDIGSPITSSTPDAGKVSNFMFRFQFDPNFRLWFLFIYLFFYVGARIGEVKRVTKETNVAVRINLDGLGIADSSTGIPFLDHMLDVSISLMNFA
ncbi:hypothetical protein RHSIM_Rhsim02G0025000 [Rhododendron simsii]|uniref:Imidazoleglycerol-phosphate dehydratase n=1 Tax=Rhododendron simsii TaxID=118357 RepID=A0A834HNJ2_RHOSS|nr:hypothetical protein RHSIM_Rhsim02G0025000 [Rhododendron simsii]